jgi:hypothetical protein
MQFNDLQEMLLRRALVTVEQIRDAAIASCGTDTTWIEQLLLSGVLDDEALAASIVAQAGLPHCGIARLGRATREALALVPADLAIEHRVVPVAIEPDGDLCLAMVDPTDLAAVQEVGFFAGRHLLREVASASTIATALQTHYGAARIQRPFRVAA